VSKILIVDDEASMRRILVANLRREGHVLVEASGLAEARALLVREDFDAVLTDQKMPDGSGLDVLRAVQEEDATTSVIFLTAVGTVELAVESMREGAFDFLTKPFVPDAVRTAVARACERTALLRENAVLRSTVRKLEDPGEILGDSSAMQALRDMVARVAATGSTVLITGETGTGKELVARAIHRNSKRARKSFIAINCGAVTETLLESELFGHEKGAFTGADKPRAGLFEAAHEGTLFLDEVAEMSQAAQAKLLRVLADGEIQRVGSTVTRHVDVRVLAATHRDLKDRVAAGQFREDLYYRLAVLPIHLPPLRERMEDLEQLCGVLSRRIAGQLNQSPRPPSQAALNHLRGYTFPGNIRELKNLLERALILGRHSELQPEDFPLQSIPPGRPGLDRELTVEEVAEHLPERMDLKDTLARLERALLVRALESADGVQAQAARILRMSRSDFGYKASKYSIGVPVGASDGAGRP
jgi:two-component system response regulator HydG